MVREADTAKREPHWSHPLSVAVKGSEIIFLPILVKKAKSEVKTPDSRPLPQASNNSWEGALAPKKADPGLILDTRPGTVPLVQGGMSPTHC